MDPGCRFDVFRRMLADLGVATGPGTSLLDFGCGQGELVSAALALGFDAYGCDLFEGEYHPTWSSSWDAPGAEPRIRRIGTPYRLPFESSCMDVVISDQVFEHVMNYEETIAELHRVMRPGGVFLHAFPSRYALIECHVHIPFAGLFRPRWWLWIWALAGVRNEFQAGLRTRETVESNAHFLSRGTNYLRPHDIRRTFAERFCRIEFVERMFLPYSNRPRFLARVPFGPSLYGLLCNRFLFGVRPMADAEGAGILHTSVR